MEITRENLLVILRTGLKRGGMGMSGLERQAGVPRDTVRDFLRGKTHILRADKLQKIMRVLSPENKVPISGVIGEGAEIVPIEDVKQAPDMVDCPPGLDASEVVAVRIKGNAMLPVFHDGWVIYYSRRPDLKIPTLSGGWQVPYAKMARASSEPFAEFLGKPCIVGLKDGSAFLGTLKRSAQEGKTYDLINHNAANIPGIKPDWAAKIIFIKTE